ncbi:hypothetical protein SLS54_008986 [Diplodia seriata]
MASSDSSVLATQRHFKDLKFNFATIPTSLTETCDPEGDIRLTAPLTILGVKQQKTFIVSSKAMRLACKAWNKMLAPDSPFLEAKEVGHGKLSFPEDDAAPLATLLHIAHLNFDKVSSYTSFQPLLDLAVLTDKYGATKLVRPWIKTWIANVQHMLLVPAYEEWLWIAWEFGQTTSFQKLAIHLVQEVKLTADGQCVTQKGRILDPSADSCHLPPDIIESIMEIRLNVIQSLFDIYQSSIAKFTGARAANDKGTLCLNIYGDFDARRKCDALTFGSLTLSLRQAGLSVESSWVNNDDCSVRELSQKLLGIQLFKCQDNAHRFECANSSLETELQQSVQKVMASIPSPVKDSHIRHLQRQFEACGVA